jgi:putative ABC transport system permease protein
MLGIGWGISTLMMLFSLGSGLQTTVHSGFEIFGTDLLGVWGGRTSEQAGGVRVGRWIRLRIDDLEFLQTAVPAIRNASPEASRWQQVSSATRQQEFDVQGVYPIFGSMRRMTLGEGRWLNAGDEMERGRVVVLGSTSRERLFGEQPAVGESVRIDGLSFEVIGVLEKKVGVAGQDDNRLVLMPYRSMGLLRQIRLPDSFLLEAEAGVPHAVIIQQIRDRLAERFGFRPTDKQAVRFWDPTEEEDDAAIITGMVRAMTAIIGAITLAIGGVGVMNIMLVSVTQRTREIGILKALGARRRHILIQFLGEALLITFLGGLLGLAISSFLVWIVPPFPVWSAFTGEKTQTGDVILSMDWPTLLMAGALLAAVGLAAGFWPAVRASRMDPIEALRHE